MFFGSNQEESTLSFKRYTGVAKFQVLCANPTADQYKDFTGVEPPYELKYEKGKPNDKGISSTPVKILVKCIEEGVNDKYDFLEFWVANEDAVTKEGKRRFVNIRGERSVFASSIANAKYYGKDMPLAEKSRPMKVGEYELIEFMIALLRMTRLDYKDKSGKEAQLLVEMKNNNITIEHLAKGDVKGLNKAIDWANKTTAEKPEPNYIAALYTVQAKEGKYYQKIVNNHLKAVGPQFQSAAFEEYIKKQHTRDAKYPVSSDLFTYKFQEFDEKVCLNYHAGSNDAAPVQQFASEFPSEPSGSSFTPTDDDLPF